MSYSLTKKDTAIVDYLAEKEIERILSNIDSQDWPNRTDRVLFRVWLDLGCRVGELDFPWTDVDWDRRLVQVRDHKKKGVIRYCTISDKSWQLLRDYRDSVDCRVQKFVFPLSAKTIDRRLKYWCSTAKVERKRYKVKARWRGGVHGHMMRKTYVVRCARLKIPISDVIQQTGDSRKTIDEIYSMRSIEERQESQNELWGRAGSK